jgi:hypothetical protein
MDVPEFTTNNSGRLCRACSKPLGHALAGKKYCSADCYQTDRQSLPLKARLERRLDKTGACWEWLGYRDADGYGSITFNKQPLRTHRVAYELANGPIPKGLQVCHTCDNPPCCNPAHLFLGDSLVNAKDRDSKGRGNVRRGVTHPCARLTEEQVRLIRALRAEGAPYKRLADTFGVTYRAVWNIANHVTWTHVP